MRESTNPEDIKLICKKFKITEIVFFTVSLLILVLKFNRIFFTGLPILSILFLGGLAILSFWLIFTGKYIYDIKNDYLQGFIGFACSALSIGILFSLQFWPGAVAVSKIGVCIALVSLVWISATVGKKIYAFDNFNNRMLLAKLVSFTLVGIWFVLTPPLEKFKQVHRKGDDPVAIRLYVETLQDPASEAKKEAYIKYIRSK